MMLRNLKALEDRRRPPAPNLNIGTAGQVNVGQQQNNVMEKGSDILGSPRAGAPE